MRRELCEFRWIHMPYEDVCAMLTERACELLQPAAASAARSAGTATLSVEVGGRRIDRAVDLEVGEPEVRGAPFPILRVPVAWKASTRPALFPTMEGQLEAYPIGSDLTQISFQGTYRPPLGAVGETADALLLHRVAEQAVARFLRVIAQRLRRTWIAARSP